MSLARNLLTSHPRQTIINNNKIKQIKLQKTFLKDQVDSGFKIGLNYSKNIINEREIYIFNHKGWIVGYYDDNFDSIDYMILRATIKEPVGILLGNCNINDFDYYKYSNTFLFNLNKYQQKPKIDKIEGKNLIARQNFMDFFQENFPTNLNFVKDTNEYFVSEIDAFYSKKIYDGTMSAAYYGCYYESIKLFYSSPNNLLLLEDIVVNYSLEELQYMFYQNCQEYLKQSEEWDFPPQLYPSDFINNFQYVSQKIHLDKLYDKKCQYTAAVFRKVHKLYPENMIFMPNNLVLKTYEHWYILI